MKKISVLLTATALLLAATGALRAAEDHGPYRSMVVPECNECHRDSDVPPNHLGGWNTEHARLASKEVQNCASCHEPPFCTDCHQGGGAGAGLHTGNSRGADTVPRSHRGDFRELHPLAAMNAPRSCEKCHQARFCADCHGKFRSEELQFASHRRSWSDSRPLGVGPRHETFAGSQCATCHPDARLQSHEWSSRHSREALRNLAACQSCHYDGDVCLKCHSAKSGLLVNPHPDNWNSIKGNLERASGRRTCVRCH